MKHLKIWRSINSHFGKFSPELSELNEDETITANQVYSDEELEKISRNGFNAIWVHGLLQHIVKTKVFPELGEHHKVHQQNLKELIARASRYNLKVFIYMQPPRAIFADNPFWKNNQDVAGSVELLKTDDEKDIDCISLCISTQKVKNFLKEASSRLIKQLPGLGGVILITASEYPAHCWSRGGNMLNEFGIAVEQSINCPRCSKRSPVEIVKEVIDNVHAGIRSVSKEVEIILWNWSWNAYEKDPSPTIINNLPDDVILMAGFERGSKKKILDKFRAIDEYSLSFSGPSVRFKNAAKLAQKRGLKVITKLQVGTTHELATAPNLPLLGNLYDKAKYIRENNLAGFMGCWNFGNMITANTAAFNYFLDQKELGGQKSALKKFAEEYFPGSVSEKVAEAWLQFAKAMDYYPFSIPFLYRSPINYSLAYQLKPGKVNSKPCGRSWLMDERDGDILDESLGGIYSLDEIIKGLKQLYRQWEKGLRLFKQGLENVSDVHKTEELNNAQCCYHVFRSIWNTYRVYKLRLNWSDKKLPSYQKIIQDELENLEQVLPVVERDKRLGFHGEAFDYMFNPRLISEKISSLKAQLTRS